MEVWPGSAYPLGVTFDGTGTNFALFSEIAERVGLCLTNADGGAVMVMELVTVETEPDHAHASVAEALVPLTTTTSPIG